MGRRKSWPGRGAASASTRACSSERALARSLEHATLGERSVHERRTVTAWQLDGRSLAQAGVGPREPKCHVPVIEYRGEFTRGGGDGRTDCHLARGELEQRHETTATPVQTDDAALGDPARERRDRVARTSPQQPRDFFCWRHAATRRERLRHARVLALFGGTKKLVSTLARCPQCRIARSEFGRRRADGAQREEQSAHGRLS
jgi:hypothetical protein